VSYDRETVHAILGEAVVCHVGFVVEGRPVVLPHLYARLEEVLYLHCSTGARALHTARGDGLEVCVTVTLLDSLVLARSAFHAVNYRSVVMHGTAAVVEDLREKTAALAALVDLGVVGNATRSRPARPASSAAAAADSRPWRSRRRCATVIRVPVGGVVGRAVRVPRAAWLLMADILSASGCEVSSRRRSNRSRQNPGGTI
jgi:nitroimidazol reductase NimA-like FMN-containing flavoprotein (pyridoxamine 5'-phosphate oxidase superfamily)